MCENCRFQATMPRYAMEIGRWNRHPHMCVESDCTCEYKQLHVTADSTVRWTHEYFGDQRVGPEMPH